MGSRRFRAAGSLRRVAFASLGWLALGSLPAVAADEDRAARENRFGVDVAGRGLWREAIYRWERAVELDPRNPKAYNNLGVAYERSGQFEEALVAYERALELLPTSDQIRQNYELFREAYERKQRRDRDAARSASPGSVDR